jgi:hypothetical protein
MARSVRIVGHCRDSTVRRERGLTDRISASESLISRSRLAAANRERPSLGWPISSEAIWLSWVIRGSPALDGAGSVPNPVSHDAACDVLIVNTVGRYCHKATMSTILGVD